MTYRDLLLTCPRCATPLDRRRERESWPCQACQGVAIDGEELARILARIAPALGTGKPVFAPRAATQAPLICAACTRPMQPVSLHELPLDRCDRDDLVWFDAGELDALLDRVIADVDARRSWRQKLRDLLFAN